MMKTITGNPVAVITSDRTAAPSISATPNMPPDAKRLMEDEAYYVSENLMTLRNTRYGNLLDGASLTLPTGTAGAGIMFIGKVMGEERLLRLGVAAEKVLGGR